MPKPVETSGTSSVPGKTPLARYLVEWAGGCGNDICEHGRPCLVRGTVPCDVLFIGEAPGQSENVLGLPFVGPAGKLLDSIVTRSIGEENQHRAADGKPALTWAFTNLVGCFPRGEDGRKAEQPDPVEIKQCRPRLAGLYDLCRPRLIVCVGSLAASWLDRAVPHREAESRRIDHPAAMLRAMAAQRWNMERYAVVTIANAVEELK